MNLSKDLMAASSTPIVLGVIAEGETYGYEIVKRVEELSGGALQWTDGMLYPLLHRLEKQGYLTSRWHVGESNRKRKYYAVTDAGIATLNEQRQQWQVINNALSQIWRDMTRSDDHDVQFV
ncbi:Transcriptional regulator PadR-like family protein [Pseudidiomarina maritima]|jgi:DNA-binding PadR family transcriptional regulator|uniref:Transcriptional regulator PadR-like family protein n=1 Tax=Pseudidiomarina maritima TaxID=519453 RepID=A0A1I6HQ42_9GAMM|nr:PadR family transcriptional regulator [Pseudidiomarina maritima]SFR56576.1 Transcriptional regulator PadR-like family protein [Pseudidiomarina maritima]